MNDDFYVYAYLDPRKPGIYKYNKYKFNYEPVYIGKGKGKRIKDYHSNKSLNKKLKSIFFLIDTIIEDNLTEEDAFEKERTLINLIGRSILHVGPLCNVLPGGEGPSHSEDSKKFQSEYMKIHAPWKGKKLSEEHRKKMSLSKKGKPRSKKHPFNKGIPEEVKKKISETEKGKIIPEETRKKMSEGRKGDKHHRYWLGKKQTEEHKQKALNAVKSAREKEGYIDPRIGRKWSEERKKSHSEKIKENWKTGNLSKRRKIS